MRGRRVAGNLAIAATDAAEMIRDSLARPRLLPTAEEMALPYPREPQLALPPSVSDRADVNGSNAVTTAEPEIVSLASVALRFSLLGEASGEYGASRSFRSG